MESCTLGYDPLFAFARAIRQLIERPYVIGGLGFLLGYVESLLSMQQQIEDKKFISFLRRQQRRRLTKLL